MSKFDHSLSRSQRDLLQEMKKQIEMTQKKAQQQEKQTETVPIDDAALFSQAMQGVTKMTPANLTQPPHKPKKKVINPQILAKRAAAEGSIEDENTEISDTQALLHPVASQAFLSYRIATIQHRVFEELKTGKMRWFEAVDLHGCTVEQARAAVLELIQIARNNNQNVIKIVHGKGEQGVLKTYVNGWLRQHREVLAFVSAPENQGGTGAVLVLLKRAEKNPKYQK